MTYKRPSQIIGVYVLKISTLKVRHKMDLFTLEKGDVITVVEDEDRFGNVVIQYPNGIVCAKHLIVLKDFRKRTVL